MNNYPHPGDPLILVYPGHVPALKNNKVPIQTGKGLKLIPNQAVLKYIKTIKGAVIKQVQRQGFDMMLMPQPVAVYAQVWFFVGEKSTLPAADLDNAYTMLQETLAAPGKEMGAVLSVIDNDRQVRSSMQDSYTVATRSRQGARLFVWSLDPNPLRDRHKQWQVFWRFMAAYQQPKVSIAHDDFDDMLSLFT